MKLPHLLVFGLFFVVFGSSAQKIKHPGLVFTVERVQQAKQRIKTVPLMAAAWEEIQKKADSLLKSNSLNHSGELTLAYLMTDDRKYADQVKSILLKSIQGKPWSSSDEMMLRKPAWRADLCLAQKCSLAAMAYDGIYNTLSAEEKMQLAKGLYSFGVEPSLGDWFLEPTRIHSLNSMGHNWWTACACMGGLLATSIENELPEAARSAAQLYEQLPEWFAFAGDELQNKMKSFDENGGMYESVNYATFGISEALLFRLGWQNAHPSVKPNEIPELAKTPEFFMYVSYPHTGTFGSLSFGDSHFNIVGDNTLTYLNALGDKNKNILWYLNQVVDGQHRESNSHRTPIGFLYAPDLSQAPAEPDLKLSQLFPDFGWATMRSSWKKDATLLAVKSGHTWNHSHADANSFVVFHQGEILLKDAGNCSYAKPEYGGYFFQSPAHNVVLFNGEGQPTNQEYEGSMLDGKLTDLMDAGNIKYVLANGTGPYAKNFVRNFRHFLWMDNVIYVLDDLKTYTSGLFEWLWHTEGKVQKNGIDMQVTNNNASVVVRPIYPEYLVPSGFIHDYPTFLRMKEVQAPTEDLKDSESYYSFQYPVETNRVKSLTAIILKDSVKQTVLPKMERMEGKDWIGLRIRNNGMITDLIINQLADGRLMHSNSWIQAEGWETDAYLFAVQYPENGNPEQPSAYFLSYGSALRRGGVSHFGSLSKLNVIRKGNELRVNGQPLIRATFYAPSKPSTLLVNGKKSTIDFDQNQITVKLDTRN